MAATARALAAGPRTGALLLVAAVLSACGGGAGDAGGSAPATSSPAALASELVVEVDRGDGSPTERYTLACGEGAVGEHPHGAAACAHLAALDDPFAPLPADVMCTEQYGGPQTARVSGTWQGEPVDLELSRVDGCRISQWDSLGPLLPGPVGVQPD